MSPTLLQVPQVILWMSVLCVSALRNNAGSQGQYSYIEVYNLGSGVAALKLPTPTRIN